MQLGVSSFAFGWAVGVTGSMPVKPMTAFDVIDFVRQQGLRLVQFGDHIPLHEWSDAELARLRAAADEAPSITLEVGARGLTATHLHAYLGIARKLRAPLLRFVIDGPGYEPSTDDVAAIIAEVVPDLAAAGVTLGIENHDRFPVRILRGLMDRIDHPNVGICLDTANSLGAGEGMKEVLDALGPVTVNLHVKDFVIRRLHSAMGFKIEGQPAGQGMLDIAATRDALAATGRCLTAVLETWTTPTSNIDDTIARERDWAEQSLNVLKPLFP